MKLFLMGVIVLILSNNLFAFKLNCNSSGEIDGQPLKEESTYYISNYKVITYGADGRRWDGYNVKNNFDAISFNLDCTYNIIKRKSNKVYTIETNGCGVYLDGSCFRYDD